MANNRLETANKKGGAMGIMRMKKGHRGFTLVELMVVMAIMAVLAAVVFPAVTGTTTTSREVSQSEDINGVQTAVDRFNADDTDGLAWPTQVDIATGSTWAAGALPTSTKTGAGTSGSPYIFTTTAIAGIDWTSAADTTGDGSSDSYFFPDFLRNKADHNAETIDVGTTSGTTANFTIKKGGADVYVTLSEAGADKSFPAWGVDSTGAVWVFVSASSY